MAGAFQSDAFQTNAFQSEGALGPVSRTITPTGVINLSGTSLIDVWGGFQRKVVVASGGMLFTGVGAINKLVGVVATGGSSFSGWASVVRSGIVKEGTFNDFFINAIRGMGIDGFNLYGYWKSLSDGTHNQLNDMKKSVLKNMGYTGTVNDMERKYWEDR